jgi:ribosomal protein S18 acetylase RimI-like enzyme
MTAPPGASLPLRLGPLPRYSVPVAAGLLADAFDDDPTAQRYGDPIDRRRVLVTLASAALEDALRHGRVEAAWDTATLAGVIAWYPPGYHPPSIARLLRTFVPAGLRLLGIAPTTTILAIPSLLLDGRRWAPRSAWYLQAVAVAADYRSRGVGTSLVRSGLDVIEAGHEAAYLRTSHRAVIAWYASLGFEVVDVTMHEDASHRIRMRRRAPVRTG